MFIKRKEYKLLKELADKHCEALKRIKELETKLQQYESEEHVCDSLCEGCQNLIEGKELHAAGYSVYGVREYTTRNCALNRKCKEYKAKECKE